MAIGAANCLFFTNTMKRRWYLSLFSRGLSDVCNFFWFAPWGFVIGWTFRAIPDPIRSKFKKKKKNGCDLVAPLLVYWIFFSLSWSSKAIVILLIEQYYLSKWQWKQFHLVKAVWTVRSWRSMDCNFTNLNQSFRSACLSWENQLVQHFPRTVCKGARNLWRELWNLCANKICAAWKSVSEKWILWIFFPAFVFCRGIKMTT